MSSTTGNRQITLVFYFLFIFLYHSQRSFRKVGLYLGGGGGFNLGGFFPVQIRYKTLKILLKSAVMQNAGNVISESQISKITDPQIS